MTNEVPRNGVESPTIGVNVVPEPPFQVMMYDVIAEPPRAVPVRWVMVTSVYDSVVVAPLPGVTAGVCGTNSTSAPAELDELRTDVPNGLEIDIFAITVSPCTRL